MDLKLNQFSVVVAGKNHNPSILNPDFLTINKIVPEEWGWEPAGPPITTPPLSTVKYANGVSLTVELGKFQVVDAGPDSVPEKSKIAQIACKYVAVLPHVRYKAVGTNFQCTVDTVNPQDYMKSRFLKTGPWDTPENALRDVGIKLVYPLTGGQLAVALDAGERKDGSSDIKQDVIIANVNFHRECRAYPATEEIARHLDNVAGDWSRLRELVRDALGTENP